MALKSGTSSNDETTSPAIGDDRKAQSGAPTAGWTRDSGADEILADSCAGCSDDADDREAAVGLISETGSGAGTVEQDEGSQNTTTNSENSRTSRAVSSCEKASTRTDDDDDDDDGGVDLLLEPTPPVPPDGGYGWVIVFCGFMINLLVDGMCYMGGMLYIELLEYFQQPKGKTQWVHTLVPAVYLLTGKHLVVKKIANLSSTDNLSPALPCLYATSNNLTAFLGFRTIRRRSSQHIWMPDYNYCWKYTGQYVLLDQLRCS